VFGSNSGWLFTDAAESLFVVSIANSTFVIYYYYFSVVI